MQSHQQAHLQSLGIRQWTQRYQPVVSTANVMVIGDALNEKTAEQLFTSMMKILGLNGNDIQLTTIPDGQLQTTQWQQHIQLNPPQLLVALGNNAAQFLLCTTSPLASLRTKVHEYGDKNIPLMVTYHPDHLLNHPTDKKNTYADLCMAKKILKK